MIVLNSSIQFNIKFLQMWAKKVYFFLRNHHLFLTSALLSATDGAARILSYHLISHCEQSDDMLWFKSPSVELHQTGTFEGRSINWDTALWQSV